MAHLSDSQKTAIKIAGDTAVKDYLAAHKAHGDDQIVVVAGQSAHICAETGEEITMATIRAEAGRDEV